ncbi:MAG: apolipoprotein N-acyltransferase [Alphaproteobacteria bacterium]
MFRGPEVSDRLDLAIAWVTVLWGWRRFLAALVAGGASALALAPVFAFPILFVTLPVLVWLIDGIGAPGSRWRVAVAGFGIGWGFGFGYFLVGLYWIGFAFLVEADQFAWMLPIAVAALPAGLALFTGVAVVVARAVWRPGYLRVVALAAAWAGLEWVRGEVLTGFPWNQLGQTLAFSDPLIQGAALAGDLGLSFLVVLVAGAPACLAAGPQKARWRRWQPLIACAAALLAMFAAGSYRLAGVGVETVPAVRLRIVQPNIAQSRKWRPAERSEIVAAMLELSDTSTSPTSAGVEDISHLIWPETALPVVMQNEPEIMAAIAALLPPKTRLLTGALRLGAPNGASRIPIFNSIIEIDAAGSIGAVYDKRRLVPFGEYLPWRRFLSQFGFRQLTAQRKDFAAGTSPPVMVVGGAPPLAASVCYEIIFSGHVAGIITRVGWILNVTNDAWFGDSPGPYQHLVQARMRAVEQGLPVIRAANTGISAVIDPFGRVARSLPYGVRGVIDSALPKALPATIFSQIGTTMVGILLVVILFSLGIFSYLK